MTPLTYDQLPKYYRQCWDELGQENQRTAVEHFLAHGRTHHGLEMGSGRYSGEV
jgi:hypothetical protein